MFNILVQFKFYLRCEKTNSKTLVFMKKLVFILFSFFFFLSCTKDSSEGGLSNDGQLNLSLNLIKDFSLQLDQTTSKSNLLEDSDFQHVYDDEITVTFISDPPGYSQSLTFNPNSSDLQTVVLPYGEYNWEIPVDSNPTEISNTLSVYGQSTQTITINDPDINLSLDVNTDYALVTVNDDYTSNVTLTHEDLSISMNSKDGYNYGYVLSGTTSSSLSLVDTNGDSYTSDLGLIQSCKHYKYQLDYSNVGVNSLICLCDPFEVIERFILPVCADDSVLTNGIVAWYPFNGNSNDESGNGNEGTNNGAVLSQDRNGENNKAYYFSGNGCSTRIDVNVDTSSIEINNSFSFSVWYRHNGNGCIGPRLLEFWPGGDSYGKFAINTNKSSGNIFNPNIDYRSSEGRMGVGWNLEPNQWTHLVYTINQQEFKIYQNGELITSPENYLNSGQTSGTIKLAQDGAFGRMNHSAWDAIDGYLDDIGIWNRVLTECEVEWLYEN